MLSKTYQFNWNLNISFLIICIRSIFIFISLIQINFTDGVSFLRDSGTNTETNPLKRSSDEPVEVERVYLPSYLRTEKNNNPSTDTTYSGIGIITNNMLVNRLRESLQELEPPILRFIQNSDDSVESKRSSFSQEWNAQIPNYFDHLSTNYQHKKIHRKFMPQSVVPFYQTKFSNRVNFDLKSSIMFNMCSHEMQKSNSTHDILQATRLCTNSLWKLSYDMISRIILTKFQNILQSLIKETNEHPNVHPNIAGPLWMRELEAELNTYQNLIMTNIRSPESEMRKDILRNVFNELDYDHDGRFTIEELDLFLRFHEIYP